MTTAKYTAAIIDDEEKLRAVLAYKVKELFPEIQIVGEAANAIQGIELIEATRPQIIFLDIRMPRVSGFEMLEQLDTIDTEVIFVTGYNEFALQALKISAVDYLLKPVADEELTDAVSKAKERIDGKRKISDYELLQHNVVFHRDQRSKITLPGQSAYDLVEISEIIRCEGEQRYTRVFLRDGSKLLSSYNIGKFKDLLEGFEFFSSHKSHLVNMHHIKRYMKEGIMVMSDDSKVPVSRRKRDDFKTSVLHLKEKGIQIDFVL
ncbi:MAG: response regulator transcription factor [Flavobacteriales bacterium]|nr:response regulator transcription factor [Flavobacteriales bacterium]